MFWEVLCSVHCQCNCLASIYRPKCNQTCVYVCGCVETKHILNYDVATEVRPLIVALEPMKHKSWLTTLRRNRNFWADIRVGTARQSEPGLLLVLRRPHGGATYALRKLLLFKVPFLGNGGWRRMYISRTRASRIRRQIASTTQFENYDIVIALLQ